MDAFKEMRICLLEIEEVPGSTEVVMVNKKIVTVVDFKVGVPGKFSREPSPLPSLLAVDEDGNVFEKNWSRDWPESSALGNYDIQWSPRTDGKGKMKLWVPVEFCGLYNRMFSCQMGQNDQCTLVDEFGSEVRPDEGDDWGDLNYCTKHDHFSPRNGRCEWCEMEERKAMIGI